MDILKKFMLGFYQLEIEKYPDKFKKNLDIEIFEEFLLWNKNYTKEEVVIFCIYHSYFHNKPIDAEMYYILEVYDILDTNEYIKLIRNLLILFHSNKKIIFYDDIYIYIKLFANTITIEEVLNENSNNECMRDLILIYLNNLNEGISFNSIYNTLVQDFENDESNNEERNNLEKNIQIKLKSLYCAEIIYEKIENLNVKKINYRK